MSHWLEAGNPVEEPPEEMSRIVNKVARYFGADLVGICRLHPNWVYSHEFNGNTREHFPIEIPAGCDSAIVMAIAEDCQTIRMSPSAMEEAAVGLGYSKMAYLANLLATFIRSFIVWSSNSGFFEQGINDMLNKNWKGNTLKPISTEIFT